MDSRCVAINLQVLSCSLLQTWRNHRSYELNMVWNPLHEGFRWYVWCCLDVATSLFVVDDILFADFQGVHQLYHRRCLNPNHHHHFIHPYSRHRRH